MKVLVDGVEVKCDNDVKVIYEDEIIDHPEVMGQLHVTLTNEGMIADTIENDGSEVHKSSWNLISDIIAETH